MKTRLKTLINNHQYLFWDISKDKVHSLSNEAILERILQYGDMPELREVISILGKENIKESYGVIKNKKRLNLRPQTINFFNLYIEKHLS